MRVDPKLVIQTLKQNHGLIGKTARELQIPPGTVINWQRKAKTPPPLVMFCGSFFTVMKKLPHFQEFFHWSEKTP